MSAIDDLLARQRRAYRRCEADELTRRMADGALIVDTRPVDQRERDGALEGAVVIDSNVLQWRLDPTVETCIPEARVGRPVVVVCNEGYSSTLAVTSLRSIGVDATDLVGGYQALLELSRGAIVAAPAGPCRRAPHTGSAPSRGGPGSPAAGFIN